jgi:tetratricopeptide (TPR) repeat protein
MLRTCVPALFLAAVIASGQAPDPAYLSLDRAYKALKNKDYDSAAAGFREALRIAPGRAPVHKDLAYTLLKIGENEAARDQFAEAARLDPKDFHAALEYAFLCYETKEQVEARRVFDRVRREGDAESRATAEQAFQNIDRGLAEGIARWQRAVELSPANFSGHEELARLAEQRDELALAAEHYEMAWRLRPDERRLLLDLGRTWKALGRAGDANAAMLAASRGAQPRVAESARALSPNRYPYVYEFRKALELDPEDLELRRELAYLLLAMEDKDGAEKEFEQIVARAPGDLLSTAQLGFLHLARKDMAGAGPLLDRVLQGDDEVLADRVRSALHMPKALRSRPESPKPEQVSQDAKALAEKSLEKGYMKDALKYLKIAHENDPVDFSVMLKLGWAYNILHDDAEAIKWFSNARQSPDPVISAEADQAWRNLRPEFARFRTTVWAFPMYSSRWHDLFGYAQAKVEMRLDKLPVRPYLSLRFVGDAIGTTGPEAAVMPQYLSESSVIGALGIGTKVWHGLFGWFEAGEALRYRHTENSGFMVPDYRGGVSFTRGLGHLLSGTGHGYFAESANNGIFVSHFSNDTLLYSQTRTGYTFRPPENWGGFQVQVYWNWNLTVDVQRQYWANYVEFGPGVRMRIPSFPQHMLLSVDALRGSYLINEGNPRRPVFNDLRAGIWYAFTH